MTKDMVRALPRPLGNSSLAARFCYHDHAGQMSFAGTRNKEPRPVILRSEATKNLTFGDYSPQILRSLRSLRMTRKLFLVLGSRFWRGEGGGSWP